jgi:RecA-family ATPase
MSERFRDGWAYQRPSAAPNVVPLPSRPDDDLREIPTSKLLRDPPRRDWMVEGTFVRGTVGMLSGVGGVGKSLCCQLLATCAVLGRPWLGMNLQRGKALYLACEDDEDELHRRQRDINRALDCTMEDVCEAGLELHPRVDKDAVLMKLDKSDWRMHRTPLMDRVVKRVRENGIQYLIPDTVTATFDGNQNDERHVRDYVTEFRKVAVMMGGIVLLTKHPSMAGRNNGSGESGSVAWNNSVRSRLYLHTEKDGGLVLERMKGNYSDPRAPKIPLVWDRGVFRVNEPEPPRWVTD